MRLIDADKLIAEWNDMGVSMNPDVFEKQVDDLINNQPTAYNVDKVVKQLEKVKNESRDEWETTGNEYAFGEMWGFDKAIEIVRKGGAE